MNRILPERFWAKVDKSGDCWVWTASTNKGYGQFAVARSVIRAAHRLSYESLIGPIPEGLQLDHLCRNTRCVNPQHLEPVTHRENLARGESPSATNGRKSECKRGHAFDEANTWVEPSGRSRHCRACHDLRKAALREARA